ncbi:VWA domain-containing protein [Nocardioides sp. JQ2195]|uniref:type II secretion system F family protein n=1 Tax=Nocardioides sp. JQ2195 TaxID=2592334 RepID=UPI00143EE388|nr:type II secretion system F family protein [Nocardioides sp. JQ2195]QIX27814.1 VWA domain-containing protein [Nocardioides sp. JQ2195]
MLVANPAHAADEINIDHVESADGKVSVLLAVDELPGGATPDLDGLSVTVDGNAVDAKAKTVEAGEIERTTVLALDTSKSMRGAPIEDAKAAAKAFLDAAPADVKIGLLTFSGSVQSTIEPTTDHAALAAAIDGIELTLGTRVYDAVVEAVGLAGSDGARSVLLLSDGKDQGGGAPIADAVSAATDNDVVVDVVSLDQRPANQALLAKISDASGGAVIDAKPAALEGVFTAQADALSNQVLVTFDAPKQSSEEVNLAVELTSGGVSYDDSALVAIAVADEGPRTVTYDAPKFGKGVMLLGALGFGIGLAILLAVVMMGSKGQSEAQRRVAAYLGEAKPTSKGKRSGEPSPGSLKDSAVALTENLVKGDFEDRLNMKLAGAAVKMTAAEWLLTHAGIAVVTAFAGLIMSGGAAMVVFGLFGAVLPWLYLKRRHKKRLAAFDGQLAETLTLMAGGLSAGLSMPQAIDSVVREGNEPVSGELRRALVEQRLGIQIEEALDSVAERMESEDFAWVVMAIRIQREVGGNLAELLSTVANTLREREYLRRQVQVLSAEGRMSGYVLGGLPIGLFLYMLLVRPDTARVLYTEPAGMGLSAAALVMLGLGYWMIAKIVKIEV